MIQSGCTRDLFFTEVDNRYSAYVLRRSARPTANVAKLLRSRRSVCGYGLDQFKIFCLL